MAYKIATILALLAVSSAKTQQSRWSRQISSYTSDISDWVPLPGPVERVPPQIKRQAVAEPRILSEPFAGFVRPTGFNQDPFPSRTFYNSPANRQLYLQSVPSAPQNYLSDQGFNQGLKFGLTQPNFPLSQGFIAPQFNFDSVPHLQLRPQTVSNPIKFETPIKANQPLQSPNLNPQALEPFNPPQKLKLEAPKFVDGYRAENNSDFDLVRKSAPLPQKLKFESTNKSKESYSAPKSKGEREEVQLLYMPLESLNRGQFNFRSPLTSAQFLNTELYNQNQRPNPLIQNLATEFQGPVIKPGSFNSEEYMKNFNSQLHEVDLIPKFSTITTPFPTTSPTTPKPKKLKPHQPPLAIFLTQDVKKEDQIKVGDVLNSLKNANTVPVLDSVNPFNAPQVFIGPSSLKPPETYVKFELPYLSNIENIDKKLRQLPFFVAPLSYNTPQGFAKIPFPSPHVGSVVINSFIGDTPPASKATPSANFYTQSFSEPIYKQEQKQVTQKPKISYYSTSSPKSNLPQYEQNYYSIEPQAVSTLRPLKEKETISQSTPIKTGSYFLSNAENQYNPTQLVNFPQETRFKAPEETRTFKLETSTTPRTTVTSTTKVPTTRQSQLLETHNPYSINQAFHFSTPLDYHNFFDEYKEPYATPELKPSPSTSTIPNTPAPQSTTTQEPKKPQPQAHRPTQQSSFNYLQNYTPEIHHISENQNLRYPVFNTNDYPSKTESISESQYANPNNAANGKDDTSAIYKTNHSEEHIQKFESPQSIYENSTNKAYNMPEYLSRDVQSTKSSSEYNNYESNYSYQAIESSTTSSTSTTTTSTTRRSPIRSRGRPRYPTTKLESNEVSTRATITRKPLRERKPLPLRSRYEAHKSTTEKQSRNQYDSNESTTKSIRTRTRGRVHYRPSESDSEVYTKKNKQNSKEQDLAYQRDVLHQNYPVTLIERASTADIEAMTEQSEKSIYTNNLEGSSKVDDTEDAYSNDKLSITEPVNDDKDLTHQYTTVSDYVTEATYIPKIPVLDKDYNYEPKSSIAPHNIELTYDTVKDISYSIQDSPDQKTDNYDILPTKPTNPITEQNVPVYSTNDDLQPKEKEEITTVSEGGRENTVYGIIEGEENTKIASYEINHEQEQEENIVETTPSYNRVRVRPGVIRQYHQVSSTESSRIRSDRRKPLQAITYRPALDKRRTTMRIEEIEADLKTKQVHTRPEFRDYKQPVYKPEYTTESIASTSTSEASIKRGQIRRRRPNYASSTEGTVTRRIYENKNRFRGRRPTEKPTEKADTETDVSTSTVKNNIYSRYSQRPKLSDRYNKKSEAEDQLSEDQESNYSINRPKYTAPESGQWSPKISKDSFKPFNPNNIADDTKAGEKATDEELDIITARNEYADILVSVTPVSNNRVQKKIPDIPPTLEALVEQSKVSKGDSSNSMSNFESMLEEVMKSLEEQDENEYTGNVMKHKGGEIGEIPPERIISSEENESLKSTTLSQDEITTTSDVPPLNVTEEVPSRKTRRRGFWKRVKKVRPANEEIELAESQYYPNVVNRLGESVSRNSFEKSGKDITKVIVTTYKPKYQFLKDFFDSEDEQIEEISNMDMNKISTSNIEANTEIVKQDSRFITKSDLNDDDLKTINPGDMDLGTGSPSSTIEDSAYYTDPTEPTSSGSIDRSDGFSFMDYLFGVTSPDKSEYVKNNITSTSNREVEATTMSTKRTHDVVTENLIKFNLTTESNYIPEEMTAEIVNGSNEDTTETATEAQTMTTSNNFDTAFQETITSVAKVESSSVSSFMDPTNVVSTSMSTEISHETEICFRGKCIKTNKKL